MEWVFVAAMALVLAAGILGYLAARPAIEQQSDRADRAEEREAEAKAAVDLLAKAARARRDGAQADADHDAALREAMAGAPPDDPRAAALAIVRVAAAREAAAKAAADQARGATSGVDSGRDLDARRPVGPSDPGA